MLDPREKGLPATPQTFKPPPRPWAEPLPAARECLDWKNLRLLDNLTVEGRVLAAAISPYGSQIAVLRQLDKSREVMVLAVGKREAGGEPVVDARHTIREASNLFFSSGGTLYITRGPHEVVGMVGLPDEDERGFMPPRTMFALRSWIGEIKTGLLGGLAVWHGHPSGYSLTISQFPFEGQLEPKSFRLPAEPQGLAVDASTSEALCTIVQAGVNQVRRVRYEDDPESSCGDVILERPGGAFGKIVYGAGPDFFVSEMRGGTLRLFKCCLPGAQAGQEASIEEAVWEKESPGRISRLVFSCGVLAWDQDYAEVLHGWDQVHRPSSTLCHIFARNLELGRESDIRGQNTGKLRQCFWDSNGVHIFLALTGKEGSAEPSLLAVFG
jgi:hypothetical protein